MSRDCVLFLAVPWVFLQFVIVIILTYYIRERFSYFSKSGPVEFGKISFELSKLGKLDSV